MATTATPTVIAVTTAQVVLPAGLQGNVTVAPPAMKKQKTSGEWRWMKESFSFVVISILAMLFIHNPHTEIYLGHLMKTLSVGSSIYWHFIKVWYWCIVFQQNVHIIFQRFLHLANHPVLSSCLCVITCSSRRDPECSEWLWCELWPRGTGRGIQLQETQLRSGWETQRSSLLLGMHLYDIFWPIPISDNFLAKKPWYR